jgi:hypothetical protein
MDPLLLLTRWSLLVLLVNSKHDPALLLGVAVVAVVALPRPAVILSPWLWVGAFVVVGLRQLATWHDVDDHVIVTTYWCGALALGLTARNVRPTIAASARLLVGAVFAFAAMWKLGSGEFLDGRFFRYELLFDERFENVSRWVGGLTADQRHANVQHLSELAALPPGSVPTTLTEGPRTEALAAVFTGWGLWLECAVAIAFLLPLRRSSEWVRHALLFAFASTTYLIVPVGGFGSLLMLLGAAQATTERIRMAYLGMAVALFVWAGVWPLFL